MPKIITKIKSIFSKKKAAPSSSAPQPNMSTSPNMSSANMSVNQPSQPKRIGSGGGGRGGGGQQGIQPTETEEALGMSLSSDLRNQPVENIQTNQTIRPGKERPPQNYIPPEAVEYPTNEREEYIAGRYKIMQQTYNKMQPTSNEQALGMSLSSDLRNQPLAFTMRRQSLNTNSSGYSYDSRAVGSVSGLSNVYSGGDIYRSNSTLATQKTFLQRTASGYTETIKGAFESPENFGKAAFFTIAVIGAGYLFPVVATASLVGGLGYGAYSLARSPTPENLGRFAFTATPIGAFGALKGARAITGLPKYKSIFVSRSTNIATTEAGTVAESTSVVQTTRTNIFSNDNFLSVVKSRTVYQLEQGGFTAQTGAYGKIAQSKGVNIFTGKDMFYKPKGVGGVAFSKGYETVSPLAPESESYLAYSAIKTQVQGSKPSYSLGVSGTINVNENAAITVGKIVPFNKGKPARAGRGTFGGITYKTSDFDDSGFTYINRGGKTKGNTLQSFEESQIAKIVTSSLPSSKTSPAPFVSSSLATIKTESTSQYYGTGTYERTDSVTYRSSDTLISTASSQVSKYYPLLVFGQKSKTRYGQSLVPMQSQTPFQMQPPIIIQPQPQASSQSSMLKITFVNVPRTPGTPNYPNAPIPYQPTIPAGFYLGNLQNLYLSSNIVGGGRKGTRYVPSFTALVFKIQGSYRGGNLKGSGLDFRPITSDFSFVNSGGNFSKRLFKLRL